MIKYQQEVLLASDTEAVVNTVNCVGETIGEFKKKKFSDLIDCSKWDGQIIARSSL